MKPITLSQWQKMTPKKRSWLVCRALGEHARVFWHCTLPSGEIWGGSYETKQRCDGLIGAARTLTSKKAAELGVTFPHPLREAQARPTTSFAHYAEYEVAAVHLVSRIIRDHGFLTLHSDDGTFTAAAQQEATGTTLAEALCLLVLKLHNLVQDTCEWHRGEIALRQGEEPGCVGCGALYHVEHCKRCDEVFVDWRCRGHDDLFAGPYATAAGDLRCTRCGPREDQAEENDRAEEPYDGWEEPG